MSGQPENTVARLTAQRDEALDQAAETLALFDMLASGAVRADESARRLHTAYREAIRTADSTIARIVEILEAGQPGDTEHMLLQIRQLVLAHKPTPLKD